MWSLLASLLAPHPLGRDCELRPQAPAPPAERWVAFTCADAAGSLFFGEDAEALALWEDLGFREGVVQERVDDRVLLRGSEHRRSRATLHIDGVGPRGLTLVAGEQWLLSCVSGVEPWGAESCEDIAARTARRWRRLRRRAR